MAGDIVSGRHNLGCNLELTEWVSLNVQSERLQQKNDLRSVSKKDQVHLKKFLNF